MVNIQEGTFSGGALHFSGGARPQNAPPPWLRACPVRPHGLPLQGRLSQPRRHETAPQTQQHSPGSETSHATPQTSTCEGTLLNIVIFFFQRYYISGIYYDSYTFLVVFFNEITQLLYNAVVLECFPRRRTGECRTAAGEASPRSVDAHQKVVLEDQQGHERHLPVDNGQRCDPERAKEAVEGSKHDQPQQPTEGKHVTVRGTDDAVGNGQDVFRPDRRTEDLQDR